MGPDQQTTVLRVVGDIRTGAVRAVAASKSAELCSLSAGRYPLLRPGVPGPVTSRSTSAGCPAEGAAALLANRRGAPPGGAAAPPPRGSAEGRDCATCPSSRSARVPLLVSRRATRSTTRSPSTSTASTATARRAGGGTQRMHRRSTFECIRRAAKRAATQTKVAVAVLNQRGTNPDRGELPDSHSRPELPHLRDPTGWA